MCVHDHEVRARIWRALECRDRTEAERLLPALIDPAPTELLCELAELQAQEGHWALAARTLSTITAVTAEIQASRTRAKNLAAMQLARGELYARMMAHFPSSTPPIVRIQGLATLATEQAAEPGPLYPGDIQQRLREAATHLHSAFSSAVPVALPGVMDGYLLRTVGSLESEGFLGTQLPIFVFEPDYDRLWAVLSLHDLSGRIGPIRHGRYYWFVGPSCFEEYQKLAQTDLRVPLTLPGAVSIYGTCRAAVRHAARQAESHRKRLVQQQALENERIYHALPAADLAQRMAGQGDRSPRLLALTSRFTTVLQYSTRDAVEAFQSLGWETRILIEDQPWLRVTVPQVQQVIREYQPDLVLVLDYLRSFWPGAVPSALPYVCWVQDHLPPLLQASAGRSVSHRDFVLAEHPDSFVRRFEYPARQCLPLSKLTRVPLRPASWNSEGDDLAYVSHLSDPPENYAAAAVQQIGAECGHPRLIAECCQRMLQIYRRGGEIHHFAEIDWILRDIEVEWKLDPLDPVARLQWAGRLAHPFNSALYRRQALRWAVQVAQELDLRLGIYGHGWPSDPEFGPWARGAVAYGPELEELTRNTKLNLQIGTYLCTHQRLLDGLTAGGFFLIRRHLEDQVLLRTAAFARQHLSPEIGDLEQALRLLPEEGVRRLQDFVASCGPLSGAHGTDDPIQMLRVYQAIQVLDQNDQLLPHLSEVSFWDRDSLRTMVQRYLTQPELRQAVACSQRESVESRFVYPVGLARTIARIVERLREEALGTAAPGSDPPIRAPGLLRTG